MRPRALPLLMLGLVGCANTLPHWSINQPAAIIPDQPLRGELFGEPFALNSAEINTVVLKLASAGTPQPEQEVTIWVGRDRLENELVITPQSKDNVPKIWTRYLKPGDKALQRMDYSGGYSLRITPISRTGAEIKVRIHLSLPDYQHSFLVGTFTAKAEIPRLLNSGYELTVTQGQNRWKTETASKLGLTQTTKELGPYSVSLTLSKLSETTYRLNVTLRETARPEIEVLSQTVESTAPAPLEFNTSNGEVTMRGAVFIGNDAT